nr:TonB-dependent receptor [Chitinophagaceae bacterium]
TFKQFLVPTAADYVPAPPAYFLLQSELLADWRFAKQTVRMNLGVSNILNTRYRDYLNRNRYFANESGRNIYIRISIPITISKQTKISNN